MTPYYTLENLCHVIKLLKQEHTNNTVNIIHKNPTNSQPFSLQYIEKEEAMNILQFWLAADNFQNQLAAKKGQYDGLEAQNDAMILYDK